MSHKNHPSTPEQIAILRWAASLGAITAEALARRECISLASARGRLSALHRRGLLSRKRSLVEYPPLFAITRAGLHSCGVRGIEPCKIADAAAHHLTVCATVAAALERCYPDQRLIGERELSRDERQHGRALASARLGAAGGAESCKHSPDLVLWPSAHDGGLPVAVEVELTVKGSTRLADICRAWGRSRVVAGVMYLVSPEVEPAVRRAVATVRVEDRVVIIPLSTLFSAESDELSTTRQLSAT